MISCNSGPKSRIADANSHAGLIVSASGLDSTIITSSLDVQIANSNILWCGTTFLALNSFISHVHFDKADSNIIKLNDAFSAGILKNAFDNSNYFSFFGLSNELVKTIDPIKMKFQTIDESRQSLRN